MPTRKQDIIRTATRLFAHQGFEATTTIQIAREAGVKEPLIFYHFNSKDNLFTHILTSIFQKYFIRLDALEQQDTSSQFQRIANLIKLHLQLVDDMPDRIYLLISACPARLRDLDGICSKNLIGARLRTVEFVADCLDKGINSGEFRKVPVEETATMFAALINGLMRQRSLSVVATKDIYAATIDFCRVSLVLNANLEE